MKFRFFGDSWFWAWKPKPYLSESFEKRTDYISGYDLTATLLKDHGHEITESYCYPGRSFNHTCHNLLTVANFLHTIDKVPEPEIWVVYVSSDFRYPYNHGHSIYPEFDFSNKDKFLEQYDNYMFSNLENIFKAGRKLNETVQILLFGAQQSLPRELFERSSNVPSNVHLVCENLIGELGRCYVDPNLKDLGRFFFEQSFVDRLTEWQDKNKDQKLDSRLIDYMYDQINEMVPEPFLFLTWPDVVHLGFSGHVCFVDFLLKYCEDNNLLN